MMKRNGTGHAKTVWTLETPDGQKLNTNFDMRTGHMEMWLDTGGSSPCFDTAEQAQTYIDRHAASFGVVPTATVITW